MKIKYPKKKRQHKFSLNKEKRKEILFFLLFVGTFLGGMFFYRSGYASAILNGARQTLQDEVPAEVLSESIEEVKDEISREIRLYDANGLATLFLDIPFESMNAIEAKRDGALKLGILLTSDDDFVPAEIRYNDGKSIDIKMRLKGDWVDHLGGDKWSFRVHIKDDDGAILGMRRFSLQAPETRNFINEWGYHQNLLLESILTTRYFFVNVVVNGEHKGIYALEESFTEDLLESQGRREGLIIRFDEDFMWSNWAKFEEGDLFDATTREVGIFLLPRVANSEITSFRSKKISNSEPLSAELGAAIELLYALHEGKLPASEGLDEELWGKYYAITDLWGAGHGTAWHNKRFYYNPIMGLLEPVAFDGEALGEDFSSDNQLAFPFSADTLFNSLGVQKAYLETLERIIKPEYIAMLEKEIGEETEAYSNILISEYAEREDLTPLELPWATLRTRTDMLNRNLTPDQPMRGNYSLLKQDKKTFLKVDVVNLHVLPIVINEIIIDDDIQIFDKKWCISDNCLNPNVAQINQAIILSGPRNNFSYTSFLIPANTAIEEALQTMNPSLKVEFYGGSSSFNIPLYSNYVPQGIENGVKPSMSLEESLETHPFLRDLGEKKIAIIAGDWSVKGDLIIPAGYTLAIQEGTSLRFEEESIFLSYSSVDIRGTEENPVLLTAEEENWGGMVVLNAPNKSTWHHLIGEKMAGISRAGWILTGGITFYKSPLNIFHAVIGNNTTEDALNIIQAPFSFEYVEFLNTSSDAFDGDFTTGTASHCSFHDIQGDAFDISGSEVRVTDSYFVNIGDKAISAGEKSNITLNNITIRNVAIGVASKDLSTVFIDSSIIDSARVAGLASYIKKPQYGSAFIEATDIEILNTEKPAICQIDSQLLLNGESIHPEDVDVDALYDQGVLGN